MSASFTNRRRRVIRLALPVILATGVGVGFLLEGNARAGLIEDAAARARATAEGALAPLLTQRDLRGPIVGRRYAQIRRAVQDRITGPGPVEQVTLWSVQGRVLFDLDQALVGSRDTSMGEVLSEASSGSILHRVVGEQLETFVAIRALTGQAVIAELDQPLGPVIAGASRWRAVEAALAVLLLLSLLPLASGLRRRSRPEAVVYVPPRPWKRSAPAERPALSRVAQPAPRGAPETVPARVGEGESVESESVKELTRASEEAPANQAPQAGEPPPSKPARLAPNLEESLPAPEAQTSRPDDALIAAEERARAAEQNYWGLQAQYRQALQEIAELESRAQERESSSVRGEEDLRLLREQVREMAERLEAEQREQSALRERFAAAELDANALRERLTLQRTQLDELNGQLQAARDRETRLEAEVHDWRDRAARLEAELQEARAEIEEFRFRTRASGLAAFRELNAETQEPESAGDEQIVVETDDRGPRVIIGMPPIVPAPDSLPGTQLPAGSENEVHPAGA
ncbi:MAG TPA: hypothetical protein VFC04_02995 [Actinomycetota bacterium]|nr:hypothetical protein [Actinomycetota bacterium]